MLVFVPVLLAHRLGFGLLARLAGTFLALSAIASGTYVVNDLVDLESDRTDPHKRGRPFASGQLPIAQGRKVALVLILAGVGGGIAIGPRTLACFAVYLAVTLGYSLHLKRKPILDVAILAFLYTLRLIAGGAAADVSLSPWLFLFSIFLFLSLALVKRYTELRRNPAGGRARGYEPADLSRIAQAGLALGVMGGLVTAWYVTGGDVLRLYRQPDFLWGICPLVICWIARVWKIAAGGEMHDDPVWFALRDPVSYASAALIVGLALAAGPI